MQVAGGSSTGFLPKNVTLAVAAFARVSPTTSESGPWVMTVPSACPTRLPSPSSQVTTALVVPLIHVKVVSPPAVQVIESVGLAALTGAPTSRLGDPSCSCNCSRRRRNSNFADL